MRLILDTNFIIYLLKYKIELPKEYKIYILDKSIKELEKLKANLALKFIKVKNISLIKTKSSRNVDDLLLTFKDDIIATQDKELKKSLKQKHIKIMIIRQKKYLKVI